MSFRRLLFLLLAALTVWRLIFIPEIELSPDEAYYFQWAQRLDWGYFSKGPGVAATIWLGTTLFGATEFGVRFFSPLLALGTSLLMFSFARRLYGDSVAVWTVLLINCTPIFNAGSLVMTIDPLSIFFWMAALYAFWLALEKSPAFSKWWPLTGALIGLGFLAKFTNAMELLSIVLVLAITPRYRRELIRPGFYAMLGTFALFTIPPIAWNMQHDWITLNHLGARGGLHSGFQVNPAEWLTFFGTHFIVYSPLVFAGFCVAVWWGWKSAAVHFKPRFLLAFTLPLFALYLTLALKQAGEANWTAPASLSLAVLAVALWHERAIRHRWARVFGVSAVGVALALSLLTINTDALRTVGIPIPYSWDPSARLRGWKTAADTVETYWKQFEQDTGAPAFLIANNYGTASSLAFYMKDKRILGPGHPPVYVPESPVPENQYYFWPRYDENLRLPPGEKPKDEYYTEELGYNPFLGRTALYVTDRAEGRPPSEIKRGFQRVEMVACFDETRFGLPLRQIRIFACYNYMQVPL
jgi:Dolichyl-phosphate-mannose-protein mannosyltransferase